MYFKNRKKLIYMFLILNIILYIFSKDSIRKYYGEFEFRAVIEGYLEFIIYSIFYFYIVSKFLRYKKTNLNSKIIISRKKANILILTIIIVNYVMFLTGNSQKAGQIYLNKFSIVSNLVPLNIIIVYYYVLFRNNEKKILSIFKFNLIIYFLYNLLTGWTGFILTFFTYELFFFLIRKKKIKHFFKYYLFSYIFLGGIVYSVMYPLKFYIRYGVVLDKLNIIEGLQKLISRSFPINSYIYFNSKLNEICKLHANKSSEMLHEILFEPIPRLIYPTKPVYFNLNQEIEKIRLKFDTISNNDIFSLGTFKYYYKDSILNFIMGVLLMILIVFILSKILDKYKDRYLKEIIITDYLLNKLITGKQITTTIIVNHLFILLLFYMIRKSKIKKELGYVDSINNGRGER